jgi:glucosylceramidase
MSVFHNRFPNVPIHFTEGSVFGLRGAMTLIDYLRNWACSYNAWVTIIDENRGPNNGPFRASKTCIMLDSRTLTVTYRNDYFLYGQFMKYVQRGAIRIGSTEPKRDLASVAFQNPGGQIVLIVANANSAATRFCILSANLAAAGTLPGNSVATYVWMQN